MRYLLIFLLILYLATVLSLRRGHPKRRRNTAKKSTEHPLQNNSWYKKILKGRSNKSHTRDVTNSVFNTTFLPPFTRKSGKNMSYDIESKRAEEMNSSNYRRAGDNKGPNYKLLLPAYTILTAAIILQNEMPLNLYEGFLYRPNNAVFFNDWYRSIVRALSAVAYLHEGKNIADGTQPWRQRFEHNLEVVPKFLRPLIFWIPKEEFIQDENRLDFFQKYGMYAFGDTLLQWEPPYTLPTISDEFWYTRSVWRNDLSMRFDKQNF